jgi:hypothetical protein
MTVRLISKTGVAGETVNVTFHLGWITISNGAVRDLFGDHASGTDNSVFPDYYPRENSAVNAYLGALLDIRTSHAFVRMWAARMHIVRQSYPGGKEYIIFNSRKLSYIYFIMYFHIIGYMTTVIYNGIIPDAKVITYVIFFSDNDIVAGLQVESNTAAAVDYGTLTYVSPGTDG